MATRAVSETQPDSCFAFYNPEKIDISVSTLGKIAGDHEMLQISIKKSNKRIQRSLCEIARCDIERSL